MTGGQLRRARRLKSSVVGTTRVSIGLALVLLALGTGCATRASLTAYEPAARTETVSETNVVVGERKRAFVGDPVLKVRSYTVALEPLGYAEANRDFNVPWGTLFGGLDVKADRTYKITGKTTLDNQDFYVVLVPAQLGQSIALLVDEDGVIYEKFLNMGATDAIGWAMTGVSGAYAKGIVVDANFVAGSARLTPVVTKKVLPKSESGEPYMNFELLYLGVDSETLRLSYREFTPDDLTRPAFVQELRYDTDSSMIRFRRFQLQVHDAESNYLDYTVVPAAMSQDEQDVSTSLDVTEPR